MTRHDVVIVGGGIVGLATARALVRRDPRLAVMILEKEPALASHQSGHNSGVIHSGIYYRPGSAKAELAVKGHAGMIRFCAEHGIRYEQCGKLIVAVTPVEEERLAILAERAVANGVACRRVGPGELAELEPNVTGRAALEVPGTAIVDYLEVCDRLAELLRGQGVVIELERECTGVVERSDRVVVETDGGDLEAGLLVNCAGLWSDRVARLHRRGRRDVVIAPFRGEYYDVVAQKSAVVSRLVYPVPDPVYPFLGVHLTRSIHGGLHAGPNAILALARAGYSWRRVNARDLADVLSFPGTWRLGAEHWREGAREVHRSLRRHAFGEALRRMVPAIGDDDLVPAPAGVRAQALGRDGRLLDDFVIEAGGRVIDVINAPSPAATASLEIGDVIAARVTAWPATVGCSN